MVLLTEAFGVATFALGWWGVPLLSLAWGLVADRRTRPVLSGTVSAVAAWVALLLLDAARGPLGEVAARLGGVIGISPIILVGITLLFPALLAWSAASVGVAMRKAWLARRAEPAGDSVQPAPMPAQPDILTVDA